MSLLIHPSISLTAPHLVGDVGDITLYDSHLAIYKHSFDLIFYFIAGPTKNDLMISTALTSLTDALTMLLRNSLEKRGVLEDLDLVLLCLDEMIDDGWVLLLLPSLSVVRLTQVAFSESPWTDATAIASRVRRPRPDTMETAINEQTIMSAYRTVKEKM